MTKFNSKNERIKRDYYRFLQEADQKAPATIEHVRQAIARFEAYTRYKDFAAFHREQAVAFKKHFSEQKNARTGKPIAKATLHATLNHLKAFFRWLAMQPEYRKIHLPDTAYFNLSEKETRIAKQPGRKAAPTLEQVRMAVQAMPAATAAQKRNRALLAFLALTGVRDKALITLKLKHVDVTRELVIQDAREVETKFAKHIETTFFPVGDDLKHIVAEWVQYMQNDLRYSPDAPLFPRTRLEHDSNNAFTNAGLEPQRWQTADPVREILRKAFEAAALPYFNPHSFRHMLVEVGYQVCKTPEEWKAWSQNLGHESVQTTYASYGELSPGRQAEVIRRVGQKELTEQPTLHQVLQEIRELRLKG